MMGGPEENTWMIFFKKDQATESGTIMAQAQAEAATGDFSPSNVVEPHSYWKFAEWSSHL